MYKKFKALLAQYYKGTATSTEEAVVDQFFNALQVGGITEAEVKRNTALHHRLHQSISSKTKPSIFKTHVVRYTALAACLAGVGLLYFFLAVKVDPQWVTQYAKKGEQLVFQLSDSTVVYLSGGSSIQYPTHFDAQERIVHLQGEAFFEVKRTHPQQSFRVESENLQVQVLGTKFNVNDVKGETISVSVHEGKVQVSDVQGTKNVILRANEKADFQTTQHQFVAYTLEKQDLDQWHKGHLKFRKATIQEVIHVLNRRLNTKVSWQGEAVPTLTISGDFKYNSIEEILNSLNFLYGIDYVKKSDGTIIISQK
ncbi:FecR family protein [Myroides odoratus]|uniref:Fec operon regulator FecR n=1 Tax=Myroides odoratus TaxID=256 RepID=A0A378RNJ5_MYROD|nr:FecR domain-containing protein [Myroides odoratus]QQU04293.1 FecR domain-containing protein [Myroides odoratus]STZ28288.1 fec operon regulator FecR [Myroides odoratus]